MVSVRAPVLPKRLQHGESICPHTVPADNSGRLSRVYGWPASDLPSLMPLGEGDELTEEIFDEIVSGHTQILPAEISTTQRQFMLARLIGAMQIGGQNISQKQALILAADLARLMDQMRQADITAEQLDQIILTDFQLTGRILSAFWILSCGSGQSC